MRLLVLKCAFVGLLFSLGQVAPALADFRFSSQRSLSAPDPFLMSKKKKKLRSVVALAALTPIPSSVEKKTDFRMRQTSLGPMLLSDPVEPPLVWGQFDPDLVALLAKIEKHFGTKAIISSGCRTPAHNRAVGGAKHSYHMKCMAADISMSGISTARIRAFALGLPERGGVGTYCSTPIVHVDVGPKRQWHWGCGRNRLVAQHSVFDLN